MNNDKQKSSCSSAPPPPYPNPSTPTTFGTPRLYNIVCIFCRFVFGVILVDCNHDIESVYVDRGLFRALTRF